MCSVTKTAWTCGAGEEWDVLDAVEVLGQKFDLPEGGDVWVLIILQV